MSGSLHGPGGNFGAEFLVFVFQSILVIISKKKKKVKRAEEKGTKRSMDELKHGRKALCLLLISFCNRYVYEPLYFKVDKQYCPQSFMDNEINTFDLQMPFIDFLFFIFSLL